jgi:xanthine dehydrogenase YagR molybdenum-binding subunit
MRDRLPFHSGIAVLLPLREMALDPASGRPFSTRAMRECLEQGAQRFGWAKRSAKPRSMRDGRYLVGQGVASAIYTHWRWPAKARVVLNADGTALVETGSHELGGGTYTVMRQVAADTLGIPVERILVHIGDTRLPAAHASIGSATMANTGAAVLLAAQAARDQAVRLATGGKSAPFKGSRPQVSSRRQRRLDRRYEGRSRQLCATAAR